MASKYEGATADKHHNDVLPLTPAELLFGEFAFGSKPLISGSPALRIGRLLESIESASTCPLEKLGDGIASEIVSSNIKDPRLKAWSGIVTMWMIHNIPTDDPAITLSLVVETLFGHRQVHKQSYYVPTDATRASIIWHNEKQQAIVISVTGNGHGFYHAYPDISRLTFGRAGEVLDREPMDTTNDAKVGQMFEAAEQALGLLESRSCETMNQGSIVSPENERLQWITLSDQTQVPLDHHFAHKLPPVLDWRICNRETWRWVAPSLSNSLVNS